MSQIGRRVTDAVDGILNGKRYLVRPAQPFLDWLHRVDSTSARLTLDDLQREPTIYLVPECDSEDEAFEFLSQKIEEIFEEHLDGWYRVPEAWPATRDLPSFRSWFELSFHSMSWILAMSQLNRKKCKAESTLPHESKDSLNNPVFDLLGHTRFPWRKSTRKLPPPGRHAVNPRANPAHDPCCFRHEHSYLRLAPASRASGAIVRVGHWRRVSALRQRIGLCRVRRGH